VFCCATRVNGSERQDFPAVGAGGSFVVVHVRLDTTAKRNPVMRKLAVLLVGLLALIVPPPLVAARAPEDVRASRLELIVIEVAGCTICDLVRLHIQPAYEASPRARQLPMRYVDITNMDEMKLGLAARVATVPTIVLMRDGREVDRITGYTGPRHFFVALGEMLEMTAD
jgi:hypothetical protein